MCANDADRVTCLFLCRGPYCHEMGSEDVRNAFRECLRARQVKGVFLFPYSCFGRCGRGPNVLVYPDGVWYEGVTPADVAEIVEHAAGGPHVRRLLADVDDEFQRRTFDNVEEVLPNLLPSGKPRRRWWWPFSRSNE